MVVTLIEWEKLDNGKWKKKDLLYGSHIAGGSKKKINPNSPYYFKRLAEKLKKIFVFCNDCKKKFSLADPCIHHLSDSPDHRLKYESYKKKKLKTWKTEHINNQRSLD